MSHSPRYEVRYHSELVGWSDLEMSDPPMAVAFGRFHAAPAYSALRTRFQMADQDASGERELLLEALSIQTVEGIKLDCAGGVWISDRFDCAPEEIEVAAFGISDFERHFPGEYERYERSLRK